jgi:DMSO/TMAO reductase YedYZ molybdopterin-dependent catalytic subunit
MSKQNKQTSTGIHALYHSDPIAADKKLWGRDTDTLSRRGFIKGSGLSALSAALGATIPFARFMPAGLIPAAFAATDIPFKLEGKDGLTVLNDRPINAETPAHLLDDKITPASRLFVRNNGIPPETSDVSNWRLEISGESCERPQSFSIDELKAKFKHYTYQLQLECGGNGRSEYNPPAKGNQWTTGAVGCPTWTGVRLKDVLAVCGVKEDAVYIGYYGADKHLSGDLKKNPISRGVPMHKANEEQTLIAWSMNGESIPKLHGYPLRLICSGWPASASGKWLKKIVIRNKVHDGAKMTGTAYRVPCKPVKPGQTVADKDMCIIESMPVKSLITFPQSGLIHKATDKLAIRGHAWAGDNTVKEVFVSIDFGTTWTKTKLEEPVNRLAWQHWSAETILPQTGYYEIWARAVDDQSRSQPMVLPGWNPKGYLNNACHRIAIKAV